MKRIRNKLLPKLYGAYLNTLALFSKEKAAKTAFNVFRTVRKGKVLPAQKQLLDTAKDKIHLVNKHQIQSYQWHGTKETVLLVHGWESNSYRWYKLIEKLQKADFNSIAFDAPAHGYSSGKYLDVPLYASAIAHMIHYYKPKYVIGHSLGGMAMMYNQYHKPDANIKKIVTIGSPSEFDAMTTNYQLLLGFNNKVKQLLDNFIVKKFGFSIHELTTYTYAKTNTKKGLLLHDRLDKTVPYNASEKVHAAWKGSQLISTEGLGHSMHQDEVNEQIIDFLK